MYVFPIYQVLYSCTSIAEVRVQTQCRPDFYRSSHAVASIAFKTAMIVSNLHLIINNNYYYLLK